MKILRRVSAAARTAPLLRTPRVLVPTMGALHVGHRALIAKARARAGLPGTVMVSIFVNPLQFGPREDLRRYPRPVARDLQVCREAGVDLVFLPDPAEMYPAHLATTTIEESALAADLCGRRRPGHFRGVCTVVAKLFNILQPTHAVFGEKDYQQLSVIRRMVADLNFPVRIVAVPTVREPDGLAVSSRNSYLTPAQRAVAPGIRRALLRARAMAGRPAAAIERAVATDLGRLPGSRLDYVAVVDAKTLARNPPPTARRLVAVAVYLGATRLIDNIHLP